MTEAEELIKKHAPIIVKQTIMAIARLDKKIETETTRKMELAASASGVRSSAHWKAEAAFELHYKERAQLYEELQLLDAITKFLSNLDQDRYKFVEKYRDIIMNVARMRETEVYGVQPTFANQN